LICDACQSDRASIFLSQRVEGVILTVDLCPDCAQQLGVSANDKINLAALRERLKQPDSSGTPANLKCPACGYSRQEWEKNGRLGCPRCYDIFPDALSRQPGHQPVGKYPGKTPANRPSQ
jgi:protein arginine kinase activator